MRSLDIASHSIKGLSVSLFSGLIVATLIAGILPALFAWIGQRMVDVVVQAMQIHGNGSQALAWPVLR